MRTLFLISLLFASLGVSSQNHYLGLRAGLNLSNVQGSSALTKYSRMKLGPCAGLTYEYKLNESIGLGVELWYNQRGFQYAEYFPSKRSFSLGITYFSMPLKVALKSKGATHFKMNVGVIPSYLYSVDGGRTTPATTDPDKESLPMDISLLAEAGIGFSMIGGTRVYFLAGYQYGVVDHKLYDGGQKRSFNHSDITISAGFMTPLKKADVNPKPSEK